MTTATARPLTQSSASLKVRKAVLYLNGAFLTLVVGLTAIFDLLSFSFGSGPLGEMFHTSY